MAYRKLVLMIIVIILFQLNSFSQKDSLKIALLKSRLESMFPDTTYWDSLARIENKSLGFTIGYSYWKYHGFEIGFGQMNFTRLLPSHFVTTGFYGGFDLILPDGFEGVHWGPKLCVWANGGSGATAMALNLTNYFNKGNSQLVLRPELGIGVIYFNIVYGYNIKLHRLENEMKMNSHNVRLLISIGEFRKKTVSETYRERFDKHKKRKM